MGLAHTHTHNHTHTHTHTHSLIHTLTHTHTHTHTSHTHSIISLTEMMRILLEAGKVSSSAVEEVKTYLANYNNSAVINSFTTSPLVHLFLASPSPSSTLLCLLPHFSSPSFCICLPDKIIIYSLFFLSLFPPPVPPSPSPSLPPPSPPLTSTPPLLPSPPPPSLQQLSFTHRASSSSNPLTTRLLSLMDKKKTNLALSADVQTSEELLQVRFQPFGVRNNLAV